MRRIVAYEWLTADGYFAAADGTLDWVVPDDEQARAAAQSIAAFDTVLFERRTYQLVVCPVFLAQGQPDRKSTRLNSSHIQKSRMPSSA